MPTLGGDTNKGLLLPYFDGDPKNFKGWWMRFKAFATAAFQDDGLLNMIEQSMTAKWPSGLAYDVVDELFKRYRPVDIICRVEMRSRLNQVTMSADEDPRAMFDQLASIQSAYNDAARKIDPDDLIAVVLEKAPAAYKSILTAEQRSKGTNLKLEDLRNCMNDLSLRKIIGQGSRGVGYKCPITEIRGHDNWYSKLRSQIWGYVVDSWVK
jgi:hypothetical protein